MTANQQNQTPPARRKIMRDIHVERERQLDRWGVQKHPDGTGSFAFQRTAEAQKQATDTAASDGSLTWTHILAEEVAEAWAEAAIGKLRAELVQAAAVIVAWLEDIDSRA